jgi:primosomal protein N' (replication factor Y)
MYYYEVLVRSERYRRRTTLTYSSDKKLAPGQLVRVPLQRLLVDGVVTGTSRQKPAGIKPIAKVHDLPLMPPQLLRLAEWLTEYYRSAAGAVGSVLLPSAIPQKLPPLPVPGTSLIKPELPVLTDEQKSAVRQISATGSYVVHGRTGSGKTRLYLELAERVLKEGKSAIILSPEISLTSQLASSFTVFGADNVTTLHSQLTAAQRLAIWRRIAASEVPQIIVGARSAIFSPVRKLGLIVIDEFHEPAYKQEQEPRYHTSRVAAKLAQFHGATLIYGSATPPIGDYNLAEQTHTPILRLEKQAILHNVESTTTIVDLRQRDNFSRSSFLSNALLEALAASLGRHEQSLLYLNRRGTARISLCVNCGWQAVCPNCDVPLAYHGDNHQLRCHSCNYHTPALSACPRCRHTELAYRGIGTKALVDEVSRLLPNARVMRFDSDNIASERFEHHYASIKAGGADILIGTQTLAKGLDLPLLSTLGVVNADSSLQLPDYTASERTYQLIRQVLGRVGRGHRGSQTIIQTFNPESPLLGWAIEDKWPEFYNAELSERKQFHYPPFYHLLTIRCRRASSASAERACQKLLDQIAAAFPDVEVNGPAPSFHERSTAGYSWQIVVKATSRSQLLGVIDQLPSTVTSYDLDPLNLL